MPSLLSTLHYITHHPLTRTRKLAALRRFISWQIRSATQPELVEPWIGGAKLAAKRGLAGATGNIYCGLHEFADMGMLIHLLRTGDTFIDVGANIGSYTVLASRVCGARTVAVEPDPDTIGWLKRNIDVNGIGPLVTLVPKVLGDVDKTVHFSIGRDAVNHVTDGRDEPSRQVEQTTLNAICETHDPVMIKIDVEGYEEQVFKGASTALQRPCLRVIETELNTPSIAARLEAYGFARMYYDPFARRLSSAPNEFKSNNSLFVRDVSFVQERLRSAPARQVLSQTL